MDQRIKEITLEIDRLTEELWRLRSEAAPEAVENHRLVGQDGEASLTDLFQGRTQLLVIHNMGERCDYCTLWADGLASSVPSIEARCALAFVSPDSPERQAQIRQERGWPYKMFSDESKAFSAAMGFYSGEYGWMPSASSFELRPDCSIVRSNWVFFGPGDAFSPVWHLFSLLPGGADGWEPSGQI